MKVPQFTPAAPPMLVLLAVSSCAGVPATQVQLEVVGIVSPADTAMPEFYQIPQVMGARPDGGILAQRWSMLGREDRSAASQSGRGEYAPSECKVLAGSPTGWEAVIDAIAARTAGYRVVIINESHIITRHRETTRRLLTKLRPLGFRVLAAEAFNHGPDGSPIEQQPAPSWPRMFDGSYTREAVFGRLVRHARALGYRLEAYEQIFDPSQPQPTDLLESVARREAEQARYLAEIVRRMQPDERLIVHVGYGHGQETPGNFDGQELELMGARFKALTGIDPLTIDQTSCREAGGATVLAEPPPRFGSGQYDVIVAHSVEAFIKQRPSWRREGGDIPMDIPTALRPTNGPLVIEAFAGGEPFEAVPIDRLFVEPGENLQLLLPPGRYQVRAVRLAQP